MCWFLRGGSWFIGVFCDWISRDCIMGEQSSIKVMIDVCLYSSLISFNYNKLICLPKKRRESCQFLPRTQ